MSSADIRVVSEKKGWTVVVWYNDGNIEQERLIGHFIGQNAHYAANEFAKWAKETWVDA